MTTLESGNNLDTAAGHLHGGGGGNENDTNDGKGKLCKKVII